MFYKPNPESKPEALRLLRAGYRPSQVAQSMGLNPNTVRGWASKAGLTKSGMGRWPRRRPARNQPPLHARVV